MDKILFKTRYCIFRTLETEIKSQKIIFKSINYKVLLGSSSESPGIRVVFSVNSSFYEPKSESSI